MIKTIEVYWNCFCNWEASWVNFRNSDFESFLSEEIASEKWAFMQNYEDEIEVRLVKMANFRLLSNSVSAGGINGVIVQLIEVLLQSQLMALRWSFKKSKNEISVFIKIFRSWIQNGTIYTLPNVFVQFEVKILLLLPEIH